MVEAGRPDHRVIFPGDIVLRRVACGVGVSLGDRAHVRLLDLLGREVQSLGQAQQGEGIVEKGE